MKANAALGLAVLAGLGVGAIAVQGLRAEAKPPVYLIAEIDVTDLDGYVKEYAQKAQKSLEAFGGRTLAAGQEITTIEGAPPKRRVVVVAWDSLDQIQAWRNSPQYTEDRKIGDKYATFRIFAIEGLPQ
ncbi:MAG TPA: DUF1330 domain-containing protein [Methyloceanibacter sp.]|nr:DUF1330 domain-containing protein [Methyloceanibacter sp.]